MRKIDLSLVIPVKNEESLLEKAILQFLDYLSRENNIRSFEIILCENGSSDNTLLLCQKLCRKFSQITYLNSTNIGTALKKGIQKAKFPYVYLNGLDNPFRFEDLKQMLALSSEFDLIYGSKTHSKSHYQIGLFRKTATYLHSYLTKIFFGLTISDTQGTIFMKRAKILPLLASCNAQSIFFQTQLAIWSMNRHLKITSVPVRYTGTTRRSKFNILIEGIKYILEALAEKYIF